MASIDLGLVKRRARRGYELERLRRALVGMTPGIVLVAVAACAAHRPQSALFFGLVMVSVGIVMLWYGRDPQRAVLPGVAAGMIPLICSLCANNLHSCGHGGCTSFCVPACTIGGAVAGLAVAAVGSRRKAGLWFWVSASALALLTGSMGCSCVGYSGIIGLAVGFGAGAVPGLVRLAFAGKRIL